jgi:hypothetical protein
MSRALASRVRRLEADREAGQHCRLCELIQQAVGKSQSEAAALARHPPHTLESLICASLEIAAPVTR